MNYTAQEMQHAKSRAYLAINNLDPLQRLAILLDVAEYHEKSFRRGFQQGWDSHARNDQVCDLVEWRFNSPLNVSISPHGTFSCSALERLAIECSTHIKCDGNRYRSTVDFRCPELTDWLRHFFPRLFSARSMSKKLRFSILNRDGFRCVYCGASGNEAILHVDHVVPKIDGGSDDESNLVTACRDCNLGKGTSHIAKHHLQKGFASSACRKKESIAAADRFKSAAKLSVEDEAALIEQLVKQRRLSQGWCEKTMSFPNQGVNDGTTGN